MKTNRSWYAVLIAVLCLLTSSLMADADFDAKSYKSSEGKSLNYRIHLPEDMDAKKTYPLVLFFHGAGERGSDNKKQLRHGVRNILAYSKKSQTPLIIVAPQCPSGEQWVNTPWGAAAHAMPEKPSASMAQAIGLLQELQTTHSVDKTRIYVSGLSMGGFGTWDIIQRMPATFAAAMPVCGGADTEMAHSIKQVPIWVFHGGSDNTVKTKRSRDMVAALKQVGGHVKYTEYKGVGHNSWQRAYSDEDALKWLLGQKKSEQTMESFAVAGPKPGDADYPTRNNNPRHKQKVKAVKAGNYDLVLIGDSIIHTIGDMGHKYAPNKAVWDKHFAPRNAINLGMNGQRTEEILWNLQNGELDFKHSPKVFMLLIGTNNSDDRHFKSVHTAEEIFEGTKAIVDLIRERHPVSKILVLRIFPRGGDDQQGVSPPIFKSSAQCIETCRRAGELTKQLADGEHVFWLDVNHVFLREDGTINTDLMWDLLHPSPAGAEVWVQAVVPTLTKLLGESEPPN